MWCVVVKIVASVRDKLYLSVIYLCTINAMIDLLVLILWCME